MSSLFPQNKTPTVDEIELYALEPNVVTTAAPDSTVFITCVSSLIDGRTPPGNFQHDVLPETE